MDGFPRFQPTEWSLKKKLFGYMLALAVLLVATLVGGLWMFGRFYSAQKDTREALDLQMDVFEKDVFQHFDHLAAAGIRLSEDTTELLEDFFKEENITFEQLTDSEHQIRALQQRMIDPLHDTLRQEDCSGVFVLLDATVNTALAGAENSRTGLYLQVNGYESSDDSVLLYRGQAQVAKNVGIMPHRKWRQEFDATHFPEYEVLMREAALPLEKTYRFTELFTLPGTSEKAMLVVVPVIGSDGTVYGLCGYEISQSYFMAYHAQMTKIRRLTGLVTTGDAEQMDTAVGLSCGVAQGYYRAPQGLLRVKEMKNGMLCFEGDAVPYVGVQRSLRLSPNNEDYMLSVLMLKSDYDSVVRRQVLQSILLCLLVGFFAVQSCLFFSRRFLKPVINGLEQIKSNDRAQVQTRVTEINDLFAYLAERDRDYEDALRLLEEEKQQAQAEKERLQGEYEKAQNKYEAAYAKIYRMEAVSKPEINTEEYEIFLEGIQNLTPTERRIFDYYLSGKTVSEIMEISSIKESTLRYHNHHIYSKLGVKSLKQLLRYAEQMQQTNS